MSRKGCPNRKGIKRVWFECLNCYSYFSDYPSRRDKRRFCSPSCSARYNAPQLQQRSIGNTWGSRRRITAEYRAKCSAIHKGKRQPNGSLAKLGSKNPAWKGGITPVLENLRRTAAYAEWRTRVFERDNHTCQNCKKRGGQLHADHIKQFAYFPELRFVVSNGRTLCVDCHKATPTFGARGIRRELPRSQK